MKRDKINWLLILQAWAMLWVVIGHSPISLDNMPIYVQILYNVAYSFHMPLFIMISGYLFCMTRLTDGGKKWSLTMIIKDKLVRLGIPYLFFTIIAMFLKSLFPQDMARQADFSIKEFIHAFLFPGDGPLGELWFIAVLMWAFALTPLWRYSFERLYIVVLLLLLLFGIHLIPQFVPVDIHFLSINQLMYNLIWFYIGILVFQFKILTFVDNSLYWWIFISLGSVLYYISDLYGLADLQTIFAICFSYGLARIMNTYVGGGFSSFRDYTYQIYLMGIFAQIAVKMVYKRVDMPYWGAFLACVLVGLYVPVIVSKIVQRIGWKPMLLCIGLKK